jgi:hypothetical protein
MEPHIFQKQGCMVVVKWIWILLTITYHVQLVPNCQRFPYVLGGHLKSIIFPLMQEVISHFWAGSFLKGPPLFLCVVILCDTIIVHSKGLNPKP